MNLVRIASSGAEAVIAPGRGGALLRLQIDGRDVLRPAPCHATDPLEMACFPLVPYANRIAHGQFRFDGQNYRLPRNFGAHPHSLHGVGWTSHWSVEAATANCATLVHDHAGTADWPWAYRAVQIIRIYADSLAMTLSVRNCAGTPAPAGLGFHPYFTASKAMRLRFTAAGLWQSAAPDWLPLDHDRADALGNWSDGAPATGTTLIDNCYSGWSGIATLDDDNEQSVSLTAEGATWLHLYRPPDAHFVCLEPVSHMPDAINRTGGMPVLASGEERRLAMRIAVRPLSA
ncbi:aldose 1-epimerase [Sphingobium algorifonticola]|uniref:aldose 1-epimerase n=1 Tax=Sphingobium algorifonticola TaxID=2008318 RepID=UPI001F493072|nr:aldose 1-epimerase [Sphingobium algorifonticola]